MVAQAVHRVTIYRYGAVAWVWRALMAFCVALGAVFLVASMWMPSALMTMGALALIVPAVFFGLVVVVRLDRDVDGTLDVWTLLFWRRRIDPARLGTPVARRIYRTVHADLDAPRVWVPVKGAPPLYVDLLGEIVNRPELLASMRLHADTLRRAP